jgi:type IX secretion system PorP/SprF family membrane protein
VYFKKIFLFTILFWCLLYCLSAQDVLFSQYFANSLYLCPAFAGSGENTRIVTNFRNQNPAIPGAYINYSAAFDRYFQSVSSGFGLSFVTSKAGEAVMSSSSISAIYSYKVRVNNNFCFNTGIEASYLQNSIDWKTFTFGDQIDNKLGFIYPTNEKAPITSNAHTFDFSGGIIGYTRNMVGGITINHLSQPSLSHYIGNNKLSYKLSGFYIGKYHTNKGIKNDVSVSPTLLYQKQQEFQHITGGCLLNKNPLIVGILYRNAIRNSDAFIVLAGIETKSFRFIYNYDINLSKFVNFIGGSHEFSLYLLFENFKKYNKEKIIICPTI